MLPLALPMVLVAAAWPTGGDASALSDRIAPPPGFARLGAPAGSFAAWLRALPVRPGRPEVKLYDGRPKGNQQAHALVFDIDVGRRDLQQCADAVIRLRAEYLWEARQPDAICFRFTSGDAAWWSHWRAGQRPQVSGSKVRWQKTGSSDGSYEAFRRYLDTVFTYAGSHSLQRELAAVEDPAAVLPGDVFIQGGFPGHAVIVIDVAKDDRGQRVFLLAQSFMPAQQIHLLRNPRSDSPWYRASSSGALVTPEWRFSMRDLHRFRDVGCP